MGGLRVLARPKVLPRGMHKSKNVENIVKHSLAFAEQPCVPLHVKDGDGGPVACEFTTAPFKTKKEDCSTWPHSLIASVLIRSSCNGGEVSGRVLEGVMKLIAYHQKNMPTRTGLTPDTKRATPQMRSRSGSDQVLPLKVKWRWKVSNRRRMR